jgi:hypothetical protein
MTRTTKLLAAALGLALALGLGPACGGGNDNLPPPPPPAPPAPTTLPPPGPATGTDVDASAATPPPPPVTLVPGAASPDPTPAPTIRIAAPAKGQTIAADKAGDFAVKIETKSWGTAPGSAYVALALDNTPVKTVYDTKAPLKLSDLGAGAVAEGQHVLAAFATLGNNESVKTPGALVVVEFFVGKARTKAVDVTKPLLVANRPVGEYDGDQANHVLIDFEIANDKLQDGKDHVHIMVTGPGIDSDKPLLAESNKIGTPYYLDNLQNGRYTVKLDLMSGDNKAVPGPWNSASREITINHDAPTPSSGAAPSPPPAAASDAGAPAPVAKPKAKK